MGILRRFLDRLNESDETRLAAEVRGWADSVEGTVRIADAALRQPVRIAGVIRRMTVLPLEGKEALQVLLSDGTGEVVAVFMGRRGIGGRRSASVSWSRECWASSGATSGWSIPGSNSPASGSAPAGAWSGSRWRLPWSRSPRHTPRRGARLGLDARERDDLVAGRERGLRLGIITCPSRRIATRVVSAGRRSSYSALPALGERSGRRISTSPIRAARPEESDEVADRHGLFDHRREDVRRRHDASTPHCSSNSHSFFGWFTRARTAARRTPAWRTTSRGCPRRPGGRHDDVGGPDVGRFQHARLARVAVDDARVGRPVLQLLGEVPPLFHQRHVVAALRESCAR